MDNKTVEEKLEASKKRQTELATELQKARQLAAKLEDELLKQLGKTEALFDLLPKEEANAGTTKS